MFYPGFQLIECGPPTLEKIIYFTQSIDLNVKFILKQLWRDSQNNVWLNGYPWHIKLTIIPNIINIHYNPDCSIKTKSVSCHASTSLLASRLLIMIYKTLSSMYPLIFISSLSSVSVAHLALEHHSSFPAPFSGYLHFCSFCLDCSSSQISIWINHSHQFFASILSSQLSKI